MHKSIFGLICLSISLLFSACNDKDGTARHRSVYYWKTDFEISGADSLFLKEHGIDRIYLRMFDVDAQYDYSIDSLRTIPIATTRFTNAKPDGIEIVPTVFITLDALRNRNGNSEAELAARIVKRVLNMCSYHDLGPVHEIQFDCDWTETTKPDYYRLCREAMKILHKQGIELSGTIRLHQVSQAEYPFDRGVLMLYNTGALKDPKTGNSIISYDDVSKYLGVKSRIKRFKKARKNNCRIVDFAYPTFSWGVAFDSNGKFDGIIPIMDFESMPEKINGGRGTVREEHSDFSEIQKVKRLVESTLGTSGSNIIFHLDSKNLSNYESNEIEAILR